MKKFMVMFCAAIFSYAAVSAQEANGEEKKEATDTLVVVVKHQNANCFLERSGKPFKKGYKAVEKAVVDGYNAVEETFVEPFTDKSSASVMYSKHYRADVELAWRSRNMWEISSSHGYSFGNGLYVGGGAGFGAELQKNAKIAALEDEIDPEYSYTPESNWKATYLIPVFADVKYSFINLKASPFVSLRVGGYADVTNSGIRTFANPAIGLDLCRFSIKVGYEYQLGCWGYGKNEQKHSVKLGLGFTF